MTSSCVSRERVSITQKLYPNTPKRIVSETRITNPKYCILTQIPNLCMLHVSKNTNPKEQISSCGLAKNYNVSSRPSLRCWSAPIQCQSNLSQLGLSTSIVNIMFHLSVNAMHFAIAIQSEEVKRFVHSRYKKQFYN